MGGGRELREAVVGHPLHAGRGFGGIERLAKQPLGVVSMATAGGDLRFGHRGVCRARAPACRLKARRFPVVPGRIVPLAKGHRRRRQVARPQRRVVAEAGARRDVEGLLQILRAARHVALQQVGAAQLAERLRVVELTPAFVDVDCLLLGRDRAVELSQARVADAGVVQRLAVDGGAVERVGGDDALEPWERFVEPVANDEAHAQVVERLRLMLLKAAGFGLANQRPQAGLGRGPLPGAKPDLAGEDLDVELQLAIEGRGHARLFERGRRLP